MTQRCRSSFNCLWARNSPGTTSCGCNELGGRRACETVEVHQVAGAPTCVIRFPGIACHSLAALPQDGAMQRSFWHANTARSGPLEKTGNPDARMRLRCRHSLKNGHVALRVQLLCSTACQMGCPAGRVICRCTECQTGTRRAWLENMPRVGPSKICGGEMTGVTLSVCLAVHPPAGSASTWWSRKPKE